MFIKTTRLAIRSAVLVAVVTPLGAAAWTNDEGPRTINTVGAHDGNNGFVTLIEGVASTCAYSGLYFDVSVPLGKAMLATLLAAKTTGQKVRVAYDAPSSSGICVLKLASLVS
jgi:hypothetical protein